MTMKSYHGSQCGLSTVWFSLVLLVLLATNNHLCVARSSSQHPQQNNIKPTLSVRSPMSSGSTTTPPKKNTYLSFALPRGGADANDDDDGEEDVDVDVDVDVISVNADETLPAEIAGASLTAFRAASAATTTSVPVIIEPPPEKIATHRNNHNHNHNHTDVESSSATLAAPAAPAGTTTTTAAGGPAPPSMLARKRLANLKERTLPAVFMLAVVGSIAKYLKEDGLIGLTLLLQGGMYQEATRVIGGDFPHAFFKWWWFLTASVALNGPRIFSWASTKVMAGAVAMTMIGIISSVIRMNWKGAEVEEFRDLLRQAAVSFLATLLVVLPSSYWIATLEEFGMQWLALPAALVIINDTMAYFFGIAFGKHKLLPVISPSKTWQGFLGAAFSTMLASYYYFSFSSSSMMPNSNNNKQQDAIFLSLVVSFIAPFGGFLASMIKRAYAQKDFGSLFPGHGGFVDRLDCQLILGPIVFLYLSLTKGGGGGGGGGGSQ